MAQRLADCLGVPVYYRTDLKLICIARGLWPWKRILIGPSFCRLTAREQGAVILHEIAHCKLFHLEKRILRLWWVFFARARLCHYCRNQEYQADRFAQSCGYGVDLAQLFGRIEYEGESWLHPELTSRIKRLLKGG